MDFDLESAMEVLQRTPGVLQAMLGGLRDEWVLNNYGDATFSPFDVVGHLIHADRTDWMLRLQMILADGVTKPFPPFDRYAMYEASQGRILSELLETFAVERLKCLENLTKLNLTSKQLDLCGRHPELGVVTVRQLLATWVVHDLGHIHQIAKAMAYQYRECVGPWKEYLTILPK
jgi:hypothetical protein